MTGELVEIQDRINFSRGDSPSNMPLVIIALSAVSIASILGLGFVYSQKDKQKMGLETKVENVLGDPTPEKFYRVNNQRVYLEIDGKPVETYFNK